MIDVYVLSCEHGKYYIGKTTNSLRRITNHFRGGATAWTSIYKPISVVEIIHDCDQFDEDKITKKYMAQYGIDNVRGGSYVKVGPIDESTKAFLQHEFVTAQDRCYKCGECGHFIRDCPKLNCTSWNLPASNVMYMVFSFFLGMCMSKILI